MSKSPGAIRMKLPLESGLIGEDVVRNAEGEFGGFGIWAEGIDGQHASTWDNAYKNKTTQKSLQTN
jgi:hypothetical protein